MPFALVILILAVTLGRGGYTPWASFALGLGAALLACWVAQHLLWLTSDRDRARYREEHRVWRRLPFLARHRGLGRLIHVASLGLLSKRYGSLEVEILPPGADARNGRPVSEYFLIGGYPFKRTGLEIPLFCLTLWIALSVAPLSSGALEILSPQGRALRVEVESLVSRESSSPAAPLSLVPFLTLQGLWFWLAYVALFFVGAYLAERRRRIETLTRLLFFVGVAYGGYGITQWLVGLQEFFGGDPTQAVIVARGSFDNRNHYAAFMEMLFLSSLGWLGFQKALLAGRARSMLHDARGKLFLYGLGLTIIGLGLAFSLSRSGLTFELIGCAAFAALARGASTGPDPASIDVDVGKRRTETRSRGAALGSIYWALGLAVVGGAVWIGIEPIATRFGLLAHDFAAENGRFRVWTESLAAIRDFWLTGTGLGSFRYVFPIYRGFGGRIFYSWAHNDYLQLLVELGVPGLLLLLWILWALKRQARRVRASLRYDSPLMIVHSGYCAALIAIALHSVTDFSLHMPANAALLAVIAGVVAGMSNKRDGGS